VARFDAPESEIADLEVHRVPVVGRWAADLMDLRERAGRREEQDESNREHETSGHRSYLQRTAANAPSARCWSMLSASPARCRAIPRRAPPGRTVFRTGQFVLLRDHLSPGLREPASGLYAETD